MNTVPGTNSNLRPLAIITLCLLAAMITGCGEDGDENVLPDDNEITLDTIWPLATGNLWEFAAESKVYVHSDDQLYESEDDIPPLPPLNVLYHDLNQAITSELLDSRQGSVTLYIDEPVEHSIAGEVLPLVSTDTPGEGGLYPGIPVPFNSYLLQVTGHGITGFSENYADPIWIFIESELLPGTLFEATLLHGIRLKGRIMRTMDFTILDEIHENCLEVLYVFEDVSMVTDEDGAPSGFIRDYYVGTVVYIPDIGPAHCHERFYSTGPFPEGPQIQETEAQLIAVDLAKTSDNQSLGDSVGIGLH